MTCSGLLCNTDTVYALTWLGTTSQHVLAHGMEHDDARSILAELKFYE